MCRGGAAGFAFVVRRRSVRAAGDVLVQCEPPAYFGSVRAASDISVQRGRGLWL